MSQNIANTYEIIEQLTLDSLNVKLRQKYINLQKEMESLKLEIVSLQNQLTNKNKLLDKIKKDLIKIPKVSYIPIHVKYELKNNAKADGLEYDSINKTWYADANKVSLLKIHKWLENESTS